MASPELIKSWERTQSYLKTAAGLLGKPAAQNEIKFACLLNDYKEYIDHNELELALNMLEELGEMVACGSMFWLQLQRAAENMKLSDRAAYLRNRAELAAKHDFDKAGITRPITIRLFCWLMFLGIGAEFVALVAFWDRLNSPNLYIFPAEVVLALIATMGLWMMRKWGFFLLLILFVITIVINALIQLQSQDADWRLVAFRIIWLVAFMILIFPAWPQMLPKKK